MGWGRAWGAAAQGSCSRSSGSGQVRVEGASASYQAAPSPRPALPYHATMAAPALPCPSLEILLCPALPCNTSRHLTWPCPALPCNIISPGPALPCSLFVCAPHRPAAAAADPAPPHPARQRHPTSHHATAVHPSRPAGGGYTLLPLCSSSLTATFLTVHPPSTPLPATTSLHRSATAIIKPRDF